MHETDFTASNNSCRNVVDCDTLYMLHYILLPSTNSYEYLNKYINSHDWTTGDNH